MGKNNNAPKKGNDAPKVDAQNKEQKSENAANKTADILDFTKTMTAEQQQQYLAGLDPNHRMDLIRVMHETFRADAMAPAHTGFTPEAVNTINRINAAMQVGALICEIGIAKNPFTMLMPPAMVETIKEIGAEMGVSLKTNLLPAPDKNGNIAVPSNAIAVSKEVEKAAKEETKIVDEHPETNPQNIKDEEGLRKAAIFVLADTKTNVRPYNRINAAIDLYYSWLYFQAADDAAKEELKKLSKANLLRQLVKIIGTCPFSMDGISKILFNVTARTNSPISAFCMLRNNSLDPSTGHPTVDDTLVADFVKILIEWHANTLIERDTVSIETCNNNIAVLSKNKKQNKTAIEKEEAKISAYNEAIESYRSVIEIVNQPDSHYADVFLEAYSDTEHEDFKTCRRIASELAKTYYGADFDVKSVKMDSFKHNMQQYIGVVLNFFRDPLSQFKNYAESNILELEPAEPEKQDEQPAEEAAKESKKLLRQLLAFSAI